MVAVDTTARTVLRALMVRTVLQAPTERMDVTARRALPERKANRATANLYREFTRRYREFTRRAHSFACCVDPAFGNPYI
jgi:hypothetical protein